MFAVELVAVAVKVVIVTVKIVAIHPAALEWNPPFNGLEGTYPSRLVLGHLLTSINRDCFVIAVPICLINRPHPWSLTTALRLLHLKILPTAGRIMMQCPVLRRRRCKAGSELEVSMLAEAVSSLLKHG